MKRLDQFFESENDKEIKPLQKGEGADDKKFLNLMHEYKQVRRREDRKEAKKILDRARKLAKEGDVSHNAQVAAAYI